MSRDRDPICRHGRKGIVSTEYVRGESHAATNVCDRPACIADAIAWAQEFTGKEAKHVPDKAAEIESEKADHWCDAPDCIICRANDPARADAEAGQ